MIPKEVLEALEEVVARGHEVLLRKERGKWVVIESKRKVVYKEP